MASIESDAALRDLEVVGRDARIHGRPEADALLQPVLAAAKQHARESARDNARQHRGDEADRGGFVLDVRDGTRQGPDVDLIQIEGTQDITDSIGLDAGGWMTIEEVWRRMYCDEYLHHVADRVQRTDADLTSWLPRRSAAAGQCDHCNDPYEAGAIVLVSDDGAVIHEACWELHEGFTAAMADD